MAEATSALTFISHKNRACTMLQSDGFTITGGKEEEKEEGKKKAFQERFATRPDLSER